MQPRVPNSVRLLVLGGVSCGQEPKGFSPMVETERVESQLLGPDMEGW